VKSYLYSFCKVKQASKHSGLKKRKVMPFNQVYKRQEKREREKLRSLSYFFSHLNESEREEKEEGKKNPPVVVVGIIFKFIVSSIKEYFFFFFFF
jgi:hypothetical protein